MRYVNKTPLYWHIAALMSISLACSTPLAVSSTMGGSWASATKEFAIVTGSVNLRDNPEGFGSDVLAVLEAGEQVQVYQSGETWCRVRVLDDTGRGGWVICRMLKGG